MVLKMKIFSAVLAPSTRFVFGCALCAAILLLALRLASADDDTMGNSADVAKTWVSGIDAGQYDNSYLAGGDAFHEKVDQNKWTMILKTIRGGLGKVLSRQLVAHEFKPNGFEGKDGEFMVLTYDTSFEKMDDAKEIIVLRREGGRWKPAGYNFEPKNPPQDDGSAPTTTTSETTQPLPIKQH